MRVPLGVVLAVLLAATPLRADEKPRLPIAPFAEAAEGDWAAYRGTWKSDELNEKHKLVAYTRVLAREKDAVRFVECERGNTKTLVTSRRTFDAKEAPSIEAFFSLDGATISDVRVADDTHLAGEKELPCKKLTFTYAKGESRYEVRAWLSFEVKATGLVALVVKGHEKADGVEAETTIKLELAGCGTKTKATLGESAETIVDEEMLDADDGAQATLPFNPWANAKAGDWAAYTVTVSDRSGTEVMGLEVKTVKGDDAEVEGAYAAGKKRSTRHSRAVTETPSGYLDAFVPGLALAPVTGFKLAEDKVTVNGKELACRRLTFTLLVKTERVKVAIWTSPEIRSGGLVLLTISTGGKKVELQLGGYGDDEKTYWGKTADTLAEKKAKKNDEPEGK